MDKNNIVSASELYTDIEKIIGSVDMCKKHHDQLISKIKLYLTDKEKLFQIIFTDDQKESNNRCGSGSCACKNGQ